MANFTLQSNKHKYSRGIKTLAKHTYISVTSYGGLNDQAEHTSEATIHIAGADTDYYLTIPDDKLQSVIDRLIEVQAKRAKQAELKSR